MIGRGEVTSPLKPGITTMNVSFPHDLTNIALTDQICPVVTIGFGCLPDTKGVAGV